MGRIFRRGAVSAGALHHPECRITLQYYGTEADYRRNPRRPKGRKEPPPAFPFWKGGISHIGVEVGSEITNDQPDIRRVVQQVTVLEKRDRDNMRWQIGLLVAAVVIPGFLSRWPF